LLISFCLLFIYSYKIDSKFKLEKKLNVKVNFSLCMPLRHVKERKYSTFNLGIRWR
jgi:hypothetical protein